MAVVAPDELLGMKGAELGASEWFTIDQARIAQFADVTVDHQFIHVDPERAAQTPFGGTIAHGFLTLSLLTHLMSPLTVVPEGTVMGVNYGLDNVRFVNPVRSGKRIRAVSGIADVTERSPGRFLVTYDVRVEIEGEDKPALVAQWLAMAVTS